MNDKTLNHDRIFNVTSTAYALLMPCIVLFGLFTGLI